MRHIFRLATGVIFYLVLGALVCAVLAMPELPDEEADL